MSQPPPPWNDPGCERCSRLSAAIKRLEDSFNQTVDEYSDLAEVAAGGGGYGRTIRDMAALEVTMSQKSRAIEDAVEKLEKHAVRYHQDPPDRKDAGYRRVGTPQRRLPFTPPGAPPWWVAEGWDQEEEDE